ncbi:M20/M25/M40 family metallo-hydrolase [Agrococcus casei]|uniref:M20/M25/M40 family metallo-hydrolase n=1 Tax=Agrococcus casei TaxID=343512 RepID=UPI003F937579
MVNDVQARDGIAERLSTLIRIPTVSAERTAHNDAFARFPGVLRTLYPRIHADLALRTVDGTGLLFHWRGETSAAPLVLMAHWDVVPAPEDWQSTGWQAAPFSGETASAAGEDWITGRGALDDKGPLVVMLDAVENLLAAGFTPAHDIWIVLGGDEEVMGGNAKAMSALLQSELDGEVPHLVLDEGGAVTDAPLSFVDARCAMIGLAEKGVLTVRLSSSGAGGHASAPIPDAPIARIANALRRIERRPLQPRLTRAVQSMLAAFAPLADGAAGGALKAAGRGGRVTAELLAASGGESAAMVRTTVAQTRISGGSADNVVATEATATLNCRILPGSSVQATMRALRRRIRDDSVELTIVEAHEPSASSPVDDRFELLSDALAASWPGVAPVPYLMMAASDSRHFHTWCPHVYRFAPLLMNADERAGIHGENERIAVSSLVRGEQFHRALVLARGGSWAEESAA